MSVGVYDQFFRGHYGDGYVIEYAFFERLFPQLQKLGSGIYSRFFVQPKFIGVSGYFNKSYASLGYRFRGAIRGLTRKFIPCFWLWLILKVRPGSGLFE
jgi:hypothetical protein